MNWEYLLPAITGLFGGLIGSIVAPWIKWHLENKRANREDRIKFLNEVRSYIENNDPKQDKFLNSPIYSRVRPYLSKEIVEDLENTKKAILYKGLRDGYKARIFEELNDLEYSWKVGLPKQRKNKQKYKLAKESQVITVTSGIAPPKKEKSKV